MKKRLLIINIIIVLVTLAMTCKAFAYDNEISEISKIMVADSYIEKAKNLAQKGYDAMSDYVADERDKRETVDGMMRQADEFLSKGSSDYETISDQNMQMMSSLIYNVLLSLGTIIAFIVGAVLGIKFITSGLEGKAEVKQMLIPYIVGLVVLFGAFTIWKIVLNILQK